MLQDTVEEDNSMIVDKILGGRMRKMDRDVSKFCMNKTAVQTITECNYMYYDYMLKRQMFDAKVYS